MTDDEYEALEFVTIVIPKDREEAVCQIEGERRCYTELCSGECGTCKLIPCG